MIGEREFDTDSELPRIATAFTGMDDEYVKIVRDYHGFYLDETRTTEAKIKKRAQSINEVYDLVTARIALALAAIEEIRAEYNPDPEPPRKTDTARSADLMLWSHTLPQATADELYDLYSEHVADPDFQGLFESEIRRREKAGEAEGRAAGRLRAKIILEIGNVKIQPLDQIEKTLNAIKSTCRVMYPGNLEKSIISNLRDSPGYRGVARDLAAFPVDGPGSPYRPVFNLKSE